MSLVPVPALKAKFALLRGYSTRISWAALAVPFGVAAKTLQYWCDGSHTRAADHMSPAMLAVLVGLFAELLPDISADEMRHLVLGPVATLEAELRAGTSTTFAGLLAREGQTGTGRLIPKPTESGLIETEGETMVADDAQILLGAWFRVAFPLAPSCRYAITLQNVQQVWAAVPFMVSTGPPCAVLVPGLKQGSDRELGFMRERRDAGLHRFVSLQADVPFGGDARLHLRDGILFDRRGLDALAAFYEAQPASKRACHVLTVQIEPGTLV